MAFRISQCVCTLVLFVVLGVSQALAAPYAAMVMDARSGEVLHSRNADTPLHPASLTKMMTLYIAFEAVQRGEITMDTPITISAKAAAEVPSKLGLRAGSKVKLRYLVRGAAVKSANDAATAIAEGISGSEAAFARRMNRTAKALGMSRTTFKNAHGLTETGHVSTARDMTIMGRRLFYDYPQYYNLFSRKSTDAGVTTVNNTNRRFLENYRGADGIKTGYTRAAGFNLVASAERGNERIIATVFGGRSTATRNARVAELLDLGFERAPSRVATRKPTLPQYAPDPSAGVGKTIRLVTAVKQSLRPQLRPGETSPPAPVLLAAATTAEDPSTPILREPGQTGSVATPVALSTTSRADDDVLKALEIAQAAPPADATATRLAPANSPKPRARPTLVVAGSARAEDVYEPEVVTRAAPATGGKLWGINVGRFPTRFAAEKELMKVALSEISTLDGARRLVVTGSRGHDATFAGMSRDGADRACRRLQSRGKTCFMMGPAG